MPDSNQFDRLAVVLVATRNPLNIGAAARAMSNFGFTDLRLVNPYDVAFREARSAVGASSLLASAREYSSVGDAVADCSLVVGTTAGSARDPEQPLVRLEQGAVEIRNQLRNGRVAILFGSEKRGLSNHDMSHCHSLLRIPAREEHGSMNLGQAVAVCLYELVRRGDEVPHGGHLDAAAPPSPGCIAPVSAGVVAPATSPAGPLSQGSGSSGSSDLSLATSHSQERITALLLDCLQESGYFNSSTSRDAEARTRRLVRRLNLSEEDADIWLGILRQILWKLNSK